MNFTHSFYGLVQVATVMHVAFPKCVSDPENGGMPKMVDQVCKYHRIAVANTWSHLLIDVDFISRATYYRSLRVILADL